MDEVTEENTQVDADLATPDVDGDSQNNDLENENQEGFDDQAETAEVESGSGFENDEDQPSNGSGLNTGSGQSAQRKYINSKIVNNTTTTVTNNIVTNNFVSTDLENTATQADGLGSSGDAETSHSDAPIKIRSSFEDPTFLCQTSHAISADGVDVDAEAFAVKLGNSRVVLHAHGSNANDAYEQRVSLLQEFRRVVSRCGYRTSHAAFSPTIYLDHESRLTYAEPTITYIDAYQDSEYLLCLTKREFSDELPRCLERQRNYLLISVPPAFVAEYGPVLTKSGLVVWDTLSRDAAAETRRAHTADDDSSIPIRNIDFSSTQFVAAFFEGLDISLFNAMQENVLSAVSSLAPPPPPPKKTRAANENEKNETDEQEVEPPPPPPPTQDEVRIELGLKYGATEKGGYRFEDLNRAKRLSKTFLTAYPSFCLMALPGVVKTFFCEPKFPNQLLVEFTQLVEQLERHRLIHLDAAWYGEQRRKYVSSARPGLVQARLIALLKKMILRPTASAGAERFIGQVTSSCVERNARWYKSLFGFHKTAAQQDNPLERLVNLTVLHKEFADTIDELTYHLHEIVESYAPDNERLIDSLVPCLEPQRRNTEFLESLARHPVLYGHANPLRWATIFCLHEVLTGSGAHFAVFISNAIERYDEAKKQGDNGTKIAAAEMLDVCTHTLRYVIRGLMLGQNKETTESCRGFLADFFTDSRFDKRADLLARLVARRTPYPPRSIGFVPDPQGGPGPAHEICRFYEMICRSLTHVRSSADSNLEQDAARLLRPVVSDSSDIRRKRLDTEAQNILLSYASRQASGGTNKDFLKIQMQGAKLLCKGFDQIATET